MTINKFSRKITVISLFILFLNSCHVLSNTDSDKTKNIDITKLEKFQENITKKISKNTNEEPIEEKFIMKTVQYKEKDTLVYLMKQNANFYKEERGKENEVRKKIYTYYDSNYSLANEGEYFLGIPIGIHKKYSVDGVLIEEKNYDINEEGILSIPEMIKVMKNNFGINIENEDEIIFLDTVIEDGKYIWRIVCKAHPEKQIKHNYAYFFDAKTGQFLRKERYTLQG